MRAVVTACLLILFTVIQSACQDHGGRIGVVKLPESPPNLNVYFVPYRDWAEKGEAFYLRRPDQLKRHVSSVTGPGAEKKVVTYRYVCVIVNPDGSFTKKDVIWTDATKEVSLR